MTEVTTTAPEISLAPARLDLRLYAGDGVTINLRFVQDGELVPMDEGVLTAQIRTNRTDDDPAAVWTVDDSQAPLGVIAISLTGEQTRNLMESFQEEQLWMSWRGSWDVQWTQTGLEPLTLFQGNCSCDSDVTR